MEKSFVFTNQLNFFEIEEKGKKRFFVKGAFSSDDLDLVNDICTKNCLISMVKQIKEGNIKMDFEHEAFTGETNEKTEIAKTRLPLAKAISAEVNGNLAEATWELNENYKKFDSKGDVVYTFKEIKQDVERKFLSGFSIAYIPTEIGHKNINGEQVRLLNDVRLLNVALTGNPINTTSQIRSIFMKSMDAVEEYKKEKKNDPDLSNKLEVKAESGSDRERRKIKKEAVSEDEDEDEDETKTYGKKKEKKAYEKDGAHAHTDDEPLGLHNHPEIEIEINRLRDLIFEMNRPSDVSETSVKSHSKENNIQKEVKNMEDNEKENATEEDAKTTETETSEESTKEEPLSEVKSILGEMSKDLKSISNRITALESKDEEEVKAPEVKTNSKAVQTQTQGIQAKSVQAGLGELA